MSRLFKVLFFVPAIVALCIFAASCGSSTSTAQYRVVQTIPDAPDNFDISVDGKTVFTNVAFGSVEPISGYNSVATGSDPIEVFQTGTTTPVINSTNLNLVGQSQSTVLVTGLYAAPTAVTLRDNNTTPPSGQAELRVVDASPSAPANLDIYIVAPGTDIAQREPDISSLQFTQQSAYQDVNIGSLGYSEFLVIVTKSGDPTKAQLVSQIYTVALGQIRTLVLVDAYPGGGSLSFNPLELDDLN